MVSGTDLFLGLLNNLVVLIVLVAAYGVLINRIEHVGAYARQAILGAVFGGFAILCMYVKIPVHEGVIVDQRNVIVALSGAFGGPLSALVSAVFAGSYRIYLGGGGAVGGTIGVCLAALAGTAIYLIPATQKNLFTTALAAAAATAVIMPGFIFVGSFGEGWDLMMRMTPPFGSAVFIGIFMGSILLNRENRRFRIESERITADRERQAAYQEVMRANQAKSDFLATMSHELRTPLNAIIGFSEMLLMPGNDALPADKRKEYLQIINTSGQHLLALINDVLDISTIEAGKREIAKTQFDLTNVLHMSIDNFERDITAKSLTLRTAYPDTGLTLRADERAVAQITLNLLSNAVKFTGPGGEITVHAAHTGDAVEIKIADNGVGIPADRIELVMEPFNRPATPAHIAAPGTGLGLSIVKSLVELHDGEVRLESLEGTGTTVIVILPDGPADRPSALG